MYMCVHEYIIYISIFITQPVILVLFITVLQAPAPLFYLFSAPDSALAPFLCCQQKNLVCEHKTCTLPPASTLTTDYSIQFILKQGLAPRSDNIVLLCSFKECNVLLHSNPSSFFKYIFIDILIYRYI